MNSILRHLWFLLLVRPLALLVLGINVRNREKLQVDGPAVIVANHNSHLDTMVLISLFPMRQLKKIRPAGAADYFLTNRFMAWFSLNIIGMVPVEREVQGRQDPLAECSRALERGDILIFYPEGSRGEPEQLAAFKNGVAHLAKRHVSVPIVPVFMQGLGKALPRGDFVLVPFFCDVAVGDALQWTGSRAEFMDKLESTMKELAATIDSPPWE